MGAATVEKPRTDEIDAQAGPGEGITPLQDDGPQQPHAGDVIADGTLVVDGNGQLTLSVGGKRPTTSSLRLVGGRVEVEGQFDKGERLVLRIECEVREVAFRNEVDVKTGQVVGCERRQKASITGVTRID